MTDLEEEGSRRFDDLVIGTSIGARQREAPLYILTSQSETVWGADPGSRSRVRRPENDTREVAHRRTAGVRHSNEKRGRPTLRAG